jgi:hypothetical protein
MVLSLALLAASATQRHDLPFTVDATSYARVQHALKDGSPDLTAPDNTFAVEREYYVLAADSDTLPADSKGNRVVHQASFPFDLIRGYRESGPTPDSMSAKFTAVGRLEDGNFDRKFGSGVIPEQEQVVLKGNRMIVYHVRTTQEQVEIHTLGNQRVTRQSITTSWSIFGTMRSDDKPLDVKKTDIFGLRADFKVTVAPPIYRFSR